MRTDLRNGRDGKVQRLLWVVVVGLLVATSLGATGRHRVREGETLAGIANRNDVSLQALMEANGIADPNAIVVGDSLIIPDSDSAGPSPSKPSQPSGKQYRVHQGDTLSEIADRHGVTVRALAQANGIRNVNMILVGLTLTIPDQGGGSNGRGSGGDGSTGGSTGADAYIVQRGDSLESITAKTGVSAASIMAANNLTKPNQLYVGARIFLAVRNPSPNPSLARCPVPGASFGYDWGFPREGGRYHQGTDLFAPKGTPVMAPASGTVTQVIGSIGGNQVTFLADNGTTYIDSHLSRFGATGHVRAGEVIGYVGNTGSARGGPTHLHFEVHPGNGVAVNAYPVLVAACR